MVAKSKVVITGIGPVSPIGIGAETFFANLVAGHCGIRPLPSWADEYPCSLAGQVTGFRPEDSNEYPRGPTSTHAPSQGR